MANHRHNPKKNESNWNGCHSFSSPHFSSSIALSIRAAQNIRTANQIYQKPFGNNSKNSMIVFNQPSTHIIIHVLVEFPLTKYIYIYIYKNCQTMSKVNFNHIYVCPVQIYPLAFDCECRNRDMCTCNCRWSLSYNITSAWAINGILFARSPIAETCKHIHRERERDTFLCVFGMTLFKSYYCTWNGIIVKIIMVHFKLAFLLCCAQQRIQISNDLL